MSDLDKASEILSNAKVGEDNAWDAYRDACRAYDAALEAARPFQGPVLNSWWNAPSRKSVDALEPMWAARVKAKDVYYKAIAAHSEALGVYNRERHLPKGREE